MYRLRSALILSALVAVSATAGAQGVLHSASTRGVAVPDGMCRVWIDGVPADRQPAPTDCATARAQAGTNARVLYGRNVNTTNRTTGPWGVGSSTTDARTQRRMEKAERKRQREIAKANRKRDKEWKKGRDHEDNDDGDDDDRDRGGRRGHDDRRQGGARGGVNTCIDANRDGRCDASTSAGVQLPRILRP